MAWKGEDGLHQQLALFQVYHNFVLPHASLRQVLAAPMATNGTGSAKVWRPCTPAMAAGLTDRVWSLKEVRLLPRATLAAAPSAAMGWLVHLHRSVCAFPWERHAPAWLLEPGWSPAFPGTKALAQELLRKCTRKGSG